MRAAALVSALALTSAAHAQPSAEAAREAEMFGAPADGIDGIDGIPSDAPHDRPDGIDNGTDTLPADARDREAALFGDETPTVTAAPTGGPSFEEMLDDANDPLTIGARFTLRGQYADYGDAYADADEGAVTPAELTAPMLLDVYLDGRPADRVRAFIGARVEQDLITADEFFDLALARLDQAWLKFDIERRVFFTVGKQRIKWGAARLWNPTDFLNRERLDPLSVIDLRLGVPLVEVHVPWEAAGANFYAIALLDDADELSKLGGAARIEWVLGPSEVSASVVARKDAPLRVGADVSAGVGPLEVRVEAAAIRDADRQRWEGTYDPEAGVTPTRVDAEAWAPQAVGSVEWGIAYGDDDVLYLTGEYFYNGAGYADGELLPWLAGTGELEPLYTAQQYAGLAVVLPAPGSWDDTTFIMSGLMSLSDGSAFVRLDHQVTVLTRLRVSSYIGAGVGTEGGEFRLAGDIPTFGVGADPLATPPTGTSVVAAPRLTAGVWLSVDI